MHVNWWSENECVTFYFFTRTVAEFDKSILWWKKNGFFMYGNEPYWLYGALQIILATFYQKKCFVKKSLFCHVTMQKLIQICQPIRNLDWYLSADMTKKMKALISAIFLCFFLVKVTISTTVSPLKKLQHHLFSEALQ